MRYWWGILLVPVALSVATYVYTDSGDSLTETEIHKLSNNIASMASTVPLEGESKEHDGQVKIENFQRSFSSAGLTWNLSAKSGLIGEMGIINLTQIEAQFIRGGSDTEFKVEANNGTLKIDGDRVNKVELTGEVKLQLEKKGGTPLLLESEKVYFSDDTMFGFHPTLIEMDEMHFIGQRGFSYFIEDELLNLRDVDSIIETR